MNPNSMSAYHRASLAAFVLLSAGACAVAAAGCSSDDTNNSSTPNDGTGNGDGNGNGNGNGGDGGTTGSALVLGSVTIDPDGNRMTYVQTIPTLASGTYTNANALEFAGNGVLLTTSNSLLVGLAKEPTWVRYTANASGKLTEQGRMSMLQYGLDHADFGNTVVDDETVVSIITTAQVAVIWNPKTMTITGEVDLSSLAKAGYDLEAWTVSAHNGLVYIPNRYADWNAGKIFPGVQMTILDPKTKSIVATATDDRCASGGKILFDKDGYGYVMGDGRNYMDKVYASVNGTTAQDNCILRINPGQTSFDPNYYYTIKSLTGGHESITEWDTPFTGSGIAYAKIFYADKLPDGMTPAPDFAFWDVPAHKNWSIKLGDPPTAQEVAGAPFSAIGFTPMAFEGKYYSGESTDGGATSDIYETDPATNTATIKFKMDGYFYGIGRIPLQQ